MIVEIQVLPHPLGTPEQPFANVDAAIAAIQQSGLKYEVGALGTTIEGEPDAIWPLLRRVHEACLQGAEGLVTVIKVEQVAPAGRQLGMDDLTRKFRE
jgi:uncharacterized protein YqgV (UPF0045/DUF77 family)